MPYCVLEGRLVGMNFFPVFGSFLFLFVFFPVFSHTLKESKTEFLPKLEFLNEQIIEGDKTFKGLTVGGISGASFDSLDNRFLFLSDAKKKHRFYKLRIKSKSPYRLEITEQVFLREKGFSHLKRNMDPEALFFYSDGKKIFVTSEGQQIFAVFEPSEILQFSLSGIFEKVWPLPSMFWTVKKPFNSKKEISTHSDKGPKPFAALPHNQILFGPKENKGFESLALDSQNQILWTATEAPLRQDSLSSSENWIRISGFSMKNHKLVAQHGYRIRNARTGLVEMQFLKPFVFLTLEREYIKPSNKIQLFLTDCVKSSDFHKQTKLPEHFKPCKKNRIFDFDNLPENITPDNLEAMAFGPWISPQQRLLVIVSDNNFDPLTQKNQILFFKFSE